MGHRFILLAAICLLASGCGRPENSGPIPKDPIRGRENPLAPYLNGSDPESPFSCDTPADQQLAEVQKLDFQKSFDDAFTMVSTFNKVEKVDCDGKLIGTAVEEAGAPRKVITIPSPEIPDPSKILGVKITNLRTCKSLTVDATKRETRTSIDAYLTGPNGEQYPIAPDPLLAKDLSIQFIAEHSIVQIGSVIPVSNGVNVVTVAYQDCAACASPKTLYTTTMKINMKHEINWKPIKTVRRSMCQAAN